MDLNARDMLSTCLNFLIPSVLSSPKPIKPPPPSSSSHTDVVSTSEIQQSSREISRKRRDDDDDNDEQIIVVKKVKTTETPSSDLLYSRNNDNFPKQIASINTTPRAPTFSRLTTRVTTPYSRPKPVVEPTSSFSSKIKTNVDNSPKLFSRRPELEEMEKAKINFERPVILTPGLKSAYGVISSETRRLLREMERRDSPVMAAKKMKLGTPASSTFDSSKFVDGVSKPPVSSLITPRSAHVLPRIATLGTSPFSRPKETADKGVSVNLLNETTSNGDDVYRLPKLKTAGGGGRSTNKFSARRPDLEEIDDEFDLSDHAELEKITFPSSVTTKMLPKSGFLNNNRSMERRFSGGDEISSPDADSFRFSHPIVVASPTDITSPLSPPTPFGGIETRKIFEPTKPAVESFKSNVSNKKDEWLCQSCFVSNPNIKSNCVCCAASKSGGKQSKMFTETSVGVVSESQKNWFCKTCFVSNPFDKTKCMACSTDKPSTSNVSSTTEEKKWTCTTCYISNPAQEVKCLACMADKPSSTSKTAAATTSSEKKWTCTTCFITNPEAAAKCAACSADKPASKSLETTKKDEFPSKSFKTTFETSKKQTWTCTTCFISNPVEEMKCLACRTPKPGANFKPISFGFLTPTPVVIAEKDVSVLKPFASSNDTTKKPTLTDTPVADVFSKPDDTSTSAERRTEATKVVRFAEPPVSFVKSISADNGGGDLSSAAETQPTTTTTSSSNVFAVAPTKPFSFGFGGKPEEKSSSTAAAPVASGVFGFGAKTSTTTPSFQPPTTSAPTTTTATTTSAPFSFGITPISSATSTTTSGGFSFPSLAQDKPATDQNIFSISKVEKSTIAPSLLFPTITTTVAKTTTTTTASSSVGGFSFGLPVPAPTSSSTSGGFSLFPTISSSSSLSSNESKFPTISTTTSGSGFSFSTTTTTSSGGFSIPTTSSGGFSIPSTSMFAPLPSKTSEMTGFNFGLPPPPTVSSGQPKVFGSSSSAPSLGFNFGATTATTTSAISAVPTSGLFTSASLPKPPVTTENDGFGTVSATFKLPAFNSSVSSSSGFNFGTSTSSTVSSGGFSIPTVGTGMTPIFGTAPSVQPQTTSFFAPPPTAQNPFSITGSASQPKTRKILSAKRKSGR